MGFMFTIGLIAATFAAIRLFSKGDERPPDPSSSSRSSDSTRTQPSDRPPPYTRAHKQVSTRTPAASVNCHCRLCSSRASSHVADSRQKPMASARTEASNQFSPSDHVLGTHPAVRTPSTTGYDRRDSSVFDSGRPREYRHTFSPSIGTQAAHQASSAPSRSQATAKTPTTNGYNRSLYDWDFDPLPSVEPRQTATASVHARASYRRSPEPEPTQHIDGYERSWAVPQSPVLTCLSDLESDESENENVGEITVAEELRKQAQYHRLEEVEARKLAKDARRRRDYRTARKHDEVAIMHESSKDLLNDKAANIIFREKNKGLDESKVDLHGLHVPEAIRYAKEKLKLASLRNSGEVRFIVGKGLHSDGEAKLRPALENLCVERGLTHSLDPGNAGMLIVQLV